MNLFNADHHTIQSCAKSVRVLYEREKCNRLKPQDVTYNDQVIPSSSSVKFLGITFDSTLTFWSHFRTVVTLACHLACLKWTLSSLQPMASLLLPSSTSTSPSSVHCLITVCQLHAWLSQRTTYLGEDTNSSHYASTSHSIIQPQWQKTSACLPTTHPRQKPVPSQMLVQAHDATQPWGTGLRQQSHTQQMQQSQQPQYTTWTDQELIFK